MASNARALFEGSSAVSRLGRSCSRSMDIAEPQGNAEPLLAARWVSQKESKTAQNARSPSMALSPALAQRSSLAPPGAPDTPMAPTICPAASIGMPPPIITTPGRFLMACSAAPGLFTRSATELVDSRQLAAVRALPSAAATVCQPAKRSRSITNGSPDGSVTATATCQPRLTHSAWALAASVLAAARVKAMRVLFMGLWVCEKRKVEKGSGADPALDHRAVGNAARMHHLAVDHHAGGAHHAVLHDRRDVFDFFHLRLHAFGGNHLFNEPLRGLATGTARAEDFDVDHGVNSSKKKHKISSNLCPNWRCRRRWWLPSGPSP